MINKRNFIPLLFLTAFFIFVSYNQIRSYKYENKLEENGLVTIGRIDSIVKYPKSSTIFISYVIMNSKYKSFETALEKKISNKHIGKFYEMKYLTESPEIVRGNYSKEITDTLAILNAGFSREDIENSNLGKE
ncbi:hypothetical protein QWY99_08275 [Flavobacterium branchiarum]|uniref:Uncharacterized protein n=1 Tax=Flavobacterium branchiarum TaxID=1114870 RepID=A0ABV5FRQ0_9FLAO|nr:hypothetical protein [Flavobacterium branchiarum]MDN3673041.1 hypothetical protein [Flavobacterium branchiarum]